MIFFLPVFAIAFTNLASSPEFIDERWIGCWLGKIALSCGHILPLKDLVSTVVRTTGTSKIRVALARATVLLMIDCRSKLEVPNNICGWWSMNATAQLSGVSRPFSLRFICCVCAIYLFLSDPKLSPPLSSFEVQTDASVVPIPFFFGEVPLSTPIKSEIGKRLLAPVAAERMYWVCDGGEQNKEERQP